jgi:20S proteasome subunit beta 3
LILFSFSPFFIECVIAGLDEDGNPFISGSDQIGCMTEPSDFVVAGTASATLVGVSEAFWEKDLVY